MRPKTRAELDNLGDIHKGTSDESIQRLIIFYKGLYLVFGDLIHPTSTN
jgi:hypothetical protein